MAERTGLSREKWPSSRALAEKSGRDNGPRPTEVAEDTGRGRRKSPRARVVADGSGRYHGSRPTEVAESTGRGRRKLAEITGLGRGSWPSVADVWSADAKLSQNAALFLLRLLTRL